ncbi:MAG: T9SS C-terminal target domain-containing protein [Calditrichaeota bacterium]|nr:MAG: T9SS C-terminal target domain-containing protein [Calditrichota bacterium]
MYISSADGDFSDNEFRTSSGSYYGVYVTGASSGPDFDSREGTNGNLFDLSQISSHGAYAAGGYPEFGDNGPHDGKNDFINRGSDKYIYNYTGATIDAEVNYWGGTPQPSWFYGSIDFLPYESSSNGAGPTWKVAMNPFAAGVDLFEDGKYEEALTELKTALLQNTEAENAAGAVFKMAKSALKLDRLPGEVTLLQDLSNSTNPEVRHMSRVWLAYLYAMQGKTADAEKIALQAPEETRAQRAELLSLVSYYITAGDEQSAERIAQLLQEKHKDEYLEFDLEVALKTKLDFPKGLGKTTAETPSSFHFINYPNPFNPATTIQFHLPESKAVTLQIFDIRGRLIRTLLDDEMAEGVHSVRWNGKNGIGKDVSAGLYFAKIKTNDVINTIKLLLVR